MALNTILKKYSSGKDSYRVSPETLQQYLATIDSEPNHIPKDDLAAKNVKERVPAAGPAMTRTS